MPSFVLGIGTELQYTCSGVLSSRAECHAPGCQARLCRAVTIGTGESWRNRSQPSSDEQMGLAQWVKPLT